MLKGGTIKWQPKRQGVESSVHAPHGANHGLDEMVARTNTNESHRDVEMEDVTQDKERWWSPGHIPTRKEVKVLSPSILHITKLIRK